MKGYWLAALGIFVAGCMASNGLQYDAISETNSYRIVRLRKGMSEKQVLQIMHKPYSYETFELEQDIYDVWFYVTRPTGLDQTRMVPQNLTPLTFKNGILVGTGYNWYYFAMKEQAMEIAEDEEEEMPPPQPSKPQDTEDMEFEKALKTFPQKTTPPPPSPGVPAAPRASSAPAMPPPSPPPAAPPTQAPAKATKEPASPPTRVSLSELFPKGLLSFIKPWKDPSAPLAASQKIFSQVQLGMSETQVMDILGSPSHYETFEVGQDVYDVWFYDHEIPFTFKNAILVGMTRDYYNGVRDSVEDRIHCYDKEAEEMKEQESEQNFDYW